MNAYEEAETDPIANIIYQAMLNLDAIIYHGRSVNLSELAVETANKIKEIQNG